MKPCVAVALSGGIDSLVSAWLLKKQGYRVIGVHFITGHEGYSEITDDRDRRSAGFLASVARSRLAPITARLDIPLKVFDCRERFKNEVIDYFIGAYRMGMTPNPCLVCNPVIKFGDLFEFARQSGARWLATGHYARVRKGIDGRIRLFRGADLAKDQSYFLVRLTPAQLAFARFPLGGMTKSEVIALAHREGLVPVTEGESQDICFIKSGGYGEFLTRQAGFNPDPGPIIDMEGKKIGRHPGLHRFTIGQRRGINCPSGEPYYVVRIEPGENRLVVGRRKDLFSPACRVTEINWIAPPPTKAIQVAVKIRYRHKAVVAEVIPLGNRAAEIRFEQPQAAITPGQGAVFYQGDEVLGGGWIVGEGAK